MSTFLASPRRVLALLSTPHAAPSLGPRLGAWADALIVKRHWRSTVRQERAKVLLDELAGLLSAEEEDHEPATP